MTESLYFFPKILKLSQSWIEDIDDWSKLSAIKVGSSTINRTCFGSASTRKTFSPSSLPMFPKAIAASDIMTNVATECYGIATSTSPVGLGTVSKLNLDSVECVEHKKDRARALVMFCHVGSRKILASFLQAN